MDKSDQLISYYRPKLRCRRVWMPVMFHCLDLIRVNSYIIYNSLSQRPEKESEHKKFTCDLVTALLGRAASLQYPRTRKATGTTPSPPKKSRSRTSKNRPELPADRLKGNPSDHQAQIHPKLQRACKYCSYLKAVANLEGTEVTQPKRVARYCVACGVHLCNGHFAIYHNNRTEV